MTFVAWAGRSGAHIAIAAHVVGVVERLRLHRGVFISESGSADDRSGMKTVLKDQHRYPAMA